MHARRFSFTLIAPAMVLVAAIGSSTALASVTSLQQVALRAGDAPAGFSHPHVKVYRQTIAQMTVSTMAGGIKVNSGCALPPAPTGWRQGMIEAFDRVSVSSAFQLCASLFNTAGDAHTFYAGSIARTLKPVLKLKMDTRLPLGRVGDEAMGITGGRAGCHCTTAITIRTYEIVFRRGTAVVDLSYEGPVTYTATALERLVTRMDARLR